MNNHLQSLLSLSIIVIISILVFGGSPVFGATPGGDGGGGCTEQDVYNGVPIDPNNVESIEICTGDTTGCLLFGETCYYRVNCLQGEEYNETTRACEPSISLNKTPLGINGSEGSFRIDVEIGSTTSQHQITLNDALTTNPNSDTITTVQIVNRQGVSGGSCTGLPGTTFSCSGFSLDTPQAGGQFSVLVTMESLTEGGNETICNDATIMLRDANNNQYTASGDACIGGYNISVEKQYLTNYDSGNGSQVNTYPVNIGSGVLNDGDWVVYEVTGRNDGPEDAWSPTLTDYLPAGLTLIDYLTGTTTSTGAVISAVNRSVGGTMLELEMTDKFFVGDTVTVQFAAQFDQGESAIPAGTAGEICNEADFYGDNQGQEETTQNNLTEACLDVPECQVPQCVAEIYGQDFERARTGSGKYGTVTIDGNCKTEGTCGIADLFPMNTASLTYDTCSGTWTTTNNGSEWQTTVSDGQDSLIATFGSQPTAGDIATMIDDFLGDHYIDTTFGLDYELYDENSLIINGGIDGSFDFDCRSGNHILSCEKTTCDNNKTLDINRVIGGPEWTPIENVQPPAEGSQGPYGVPSAIPVIDGFTCNSCDDDPDLTGVCGDGDLNIGEECDDGNTTNGDGCSASCIDEDPGAVCGNEIIEPGEECDDGNTQGGDGCSATCDVEGDRPFECGNGIIEPGEECDDNNTQGGDGCSAICEIEGDGVPECGNDILERGEECDDGNTTSGDGCSAICEEETADLTCGDKFYDSGGVSNDYQNNESLSWIICPEYDQNGNPLGSVELDFVGDISTETGPDILRIYDGLDPTAPLLEEYSGNYNNIDPVQSTHASGCVYATFESDNQVNGYGWDADVLCTNVGGDGQCIDYPDTYDDQPATNTGNGCVSGDFSDRTNTQVSWRWSCLGTDGGADVDCKARKSYCGDNVCNGAETCADCPEDCGPCAQPECEIYTAPSGSQPATTLETACDETTAGERGDLTNTSTHRRRECIGFDGVTATVCQSPKATGTCGDGTVDPGEECDDGGDTDNEACTNDCKIARCGDGIVQESLGEQCDRDIGCDTTCQWIQPSCEIIPSTNTIFAGGTVFFQLIYPLELPGAPFFECAGGGSCGDGWIDYDGLDNDLTTEADNEECDLGSQNGVPGSGCSDQCKFEFN